MNKYTVLRKNGLFYYKTCFLPRSIKASPGFVVNPGQEQQKFWKVLFPSGSNCLWGAMRLSRRFQWPERRILLHSFLCSFFFKGCNVNIEFSAKKIVKIHDFFSSISCHHPFHVNEDAWSLYAKIFQLCIFFISTPTDIMMTSSFHLFNLNLIFSHYSFDQKLFCVFPQNLGWCTHI